MPDNISENDAQNEIERSLAEIEHEIIGAYRRRDASGSSAEGSIKDLRSLNKESLKAITVEGLDRSRDVLEKLICQQLRYCTASRSQPVALLLAFIDAVIDAHVPFLSQYPVPTVTSAAYIIKSGVLDDFCNCKKRHGA